MWPNPQETADLLKFTEEILNGKLHFLCSVTEKRRRKNNQIIINPKRWDTSVSTQIAHYNHIKGSLKRPESIKNYIVRFKILVLTSKACFSEPNSSKES